MSSYKLQVVSSYACELAEGPHWDEKESKLYHIDLIKGHCYKLDPESKQHERLEMPDATTLIVPVDGEEGKFLISQDRTICKLNWATKELQEIVTVDTDGRDTRINDGKVDPAGRLWFGTMAWERVAGVFPPGLGSLYCLNNQHKVRKVEPNITISNGLAWTSDAKKFFYIDSHAYAVWIYDYDQTTGEISNKKTVFDFCNNYDVLDKCEIPDGMTVDMNGHIYVAVFHGRKVLKIDSLTGKLLSIIKTPSTRTTSATFGGHDFSKLYLTSAQFGAPPEELAGDPDAGKIFEVTFEKENIKGSRNMPFKSLI